MARGTKLDRILRVRTLQLGLIQADEARARDKTASEIALRDRIAHLAASVAPAPAPVAGFSLVAAAHYRERLNQSAAAAAQRLQTAEAQTARAAEATREARRGQSAVEKLIARVDADAALKAIRALEAAPPTRKIRHDPC